METSSALLALCAGNSPITGEFLAQRLVTRSFDAPFDLRLNKRLSKQSWGWWFETPSRSLWRHRNGSSMKYFTMASLRLPATASYWLSNSYKEAIFIKISSTVVPALRSHSLTSLLIWFQEWATLQLGKISTNTFLSVLFRSVIFIMTISYFETEGNRYYLFI